MSPLLFLAIALLLPVGSAQVGRPAVPARSGPSGAAQPDYRLGPGDTIRVTVWNGNEYQERDLTLSADGQILIPFLVSRVVPVAGMTAIEVRNLIQKELERNFREPVVQVITLTFESRRAMLVGEISFPGQYPLVGQTPVLEFVLQNGGYTPKANLGQVQINRSGGPRETVNLYDIFIKGDRTQNVMVQPDDVVFVPSVETLNNKYFMVGEVRTPGVLQTPDRLNLLEAISRSGSLTTAAKSDQVVVVRVRPEGSDVMEIRFSDLIRRGDASKNVQLENGDIVFVPRNRLTRMADVLTGINPLLTFVRDTVILADIFANRRVR